MGYPILVQGQKAPRKILLDRFRSTENAVLFGTSSFWQGIDVQGEKAPQCDHREAAVRSAG
jgi:ATP-dependent DNA helicase DinG